jgi:hypothetical protein
MPNARFPCTRKCLHRKSNFIILLQTCEREQTVENMLYTKFTESISFLKSLALIQPYRSPYIRHSKHMSQLQCLYNSHLSRIHCSHFHVHCKLLPCPPSSDVQCYLNPLTITAGEICYHVRDQGGCMWPWGCTSCWWMCTIKSRIMPFMPTKSDACTSMLLTPGQLFTAKSCKGEKRVLDASKLGSTS